MVALTIPPGFSGNFSFSVLTNHDNIISVLECSTLSISKWKHNHPSDTEDETLVGLMSEDEGEGMGWCEGVARWGGSCRGQNQNPDQRPLQCPLGAKFSSRRGPFYVSSSRYPY